MECFKRLAERATARDFDRQATEPQVRVSILNRFTWLGTPQTVRAAWLRLELGRPDLR